MTDPTKDLSTPRPWVVDADDPTGNGQLFISDDRDAPIAIMEGIGDHQANAELIVRAVNGYADLREQLRFCVEQLEAVMASCSPNSPRNLWADCQTVVANARAILGEERSPEGWEEG